MRTWVDVKLNSFYMLMFESRTTAHRVGGPRVAGLLTLVGGVGGRSDIGLLDGKTSTERSGDGVIATRTVQTLPVDAREIQYTVVGLEEVQYTSSACKV